MKLRVATFNIRNADSDDGPNGWAFRESAIGEFIKSLDADLYCFQEVLPRQLAKLEQTLVGYQWIGAGRLDGEREGEFAPIFTRTGELDDSGTFWLSETPEVPGSVSWSTACERICTWADVNWSGRKVRVLNTHLDHVSERARQEGVRLILERSGGDIPAILAGDFNSSPESIPPSMVMQAGFQTSLGTPETTFHDWGRRDEGQIDYIFTRRIPILASQVMPARFGERLVSDHHAVIAELNLS